jgi:MFS family permease
MSSGKRPPRDAIRQSNKPSATFFGYVNAVSSIFSLQLGPALAAASMSSLLWRPFWIGIILLLLAVPLISALPSPPSTRNKSPPSGTDEEDALIPRPGLDLKSTTARRFRTTLALLANPTRNFLLLLSVFFLASLASSDTKLLPLYISKRYGWRFASVGYLLSVKAVFNFVFLSLVVPWFLRWRQRRHSRSRSPVAATASAAEGRSRSCSPRPRSRPRSRSGPATSDTAARSARENVANAHTCLVFSVLGALAIALSPAIWALVPALLVYALGIALPMFTYSLLKAPGMGLERQQTEDASGMQLFSVVMLVRTVGTLAGAVVMPGLWVAALGVGGWALGMPYAVSAVCYALAGVVVRRIEV